MAFDRFKFGSKVKEADLKRVEDNIDLMEKSRDAFRRYLARILKSKMYLDGIDEDADTMDTLIGRIDDLGSKWILEDNKKVAFPGGCSWTDIRKNMHMDSVVLYCRNTGTADDYGQIQIKGRYLEIVGDPRLVIANKNRTLETINDRYFDYTIDASSMSGIAEADGGAYFTIYFDPDSHTNGVELKINGDCVEWVCFNTTFPILLDLGNHTAKRVENIACGPVIMRIKDNDTLEQVVGVRFRTDSQIIAFENCTALKVLDNVDMSYINPYYRFEGCASMVTAPNFNTSNCSRLDQLFKGCDELKEFPELDMSSCKNAREMFMQTKALRDSDFNGKLKNTGNLVITEGMFQDSFASVILDDFSGVRNASRMYKNNTIASGNIGDIRFVGEAGKNTIVDAREMLSYNEGDTHEDIEFVWDRVIDFDGNLRKPSELENDPYPNNTLFDRWQDRYAPEVKYHVITGSTCYIRIENVEGITVEEFTGDGSYNGYVAFGDPSLGEGTVEGDVFTGWFKLKSNTEYISFTALTFGGYHDQGKHPKGYFYYNGDFLNSINSITTTNCSIKADALYRGRRRLDVNNLGLTSTTKIHSANGMFEDCGGLTTLPVADFSECTRYSYMYKGCSNIVDNSNIIMEFGNLEWTAAYPASEGIFDGCKKITGTLTINNMCKPYDFFLTSAGCPIDEASNFTAVTFSNMTGDVAGCKIAVHNQNMNASALNAMFDSLADVNAKNTERGVQSYIIIEGNPGAATCNTTIATNKGWTIATS